MLNSFKTRRLTALLMLASMTNAAAFAAAQPPAPRPPTGTKQPLYVPLGECDYSEDGCGGDPTLGDAGGWGGGGVGGSSDGGGYNAAACSSGTSSPCKEVKTETCLQWVNTSGTGGMTVQTGTAPGGGVTTSSTRTCAVSTTVTKTWYWSK